MKIEKVRVAKLVEKAKNREKSVK